MQIAPRPAATQIVGTVVFSRATAYTGLTDFNEARALHRIAPGAKHDWDGSGQRFAWHIERVRPLAQPVQVESTGQTGFGPRPFSVVFADLSPRCPFQRQAARL